MAFLRKIGQPLFNGTCSHNLSLHTSAALFKKQGSAGIIVIGEEILKGQVADTNSQFIARHLFDKGIKVKRISVIGDHEDEIATEVQLFSKNFSYVITTGGIGPTHDDVTFSAIAKAFGEEVKPHPELVKLCADFFRTEDLNSPAMKLAHIPESAKLVYGHDKSTGRRTLYPNISVHNVFIFPGIPSLMQKLFLSVYEELFKEGNERMHVKNLYLNCTEVEFADQLNKVVSKYPDVTFGSYPKLFDRYYKVQVTIHSVTKEEGEKAYNDLLALIPREYIVNFDTAPTSNSYQKILNFVVEKKKKHVQNTVESIERFFQVYRPTEICVVFNGDPESVVMTHLIHGCLRKNAEKISLNGVSFMEKPYPSELEQFIQETQARYNMKLERFSGPLTNTLNAFIGIHEHFKAVFIGCVTDNNSGMSQLLTHAEKNHSSIQWVNPLKDWTKRDVWEFIDSLSLPYSTFYNREK